MLQAYNPFVMTAPEVQVVQRKLDETLAQIRQTQDPERKRALLKEMRVLMAQLDSLVFDHTRFPKRDETEE